MTILARRLEAALPSATKAMTAKARELQAAGNDVIALSQGEPDFDTPANIGRAGIIAIQSGKTRYTPVAGVEPLRQAIAKKFARDSGFLSPQSKLLWAAGPNKLFSTPCWPR